MSSVRMSRDIVVCLCRLLSSLLSVFAGSIDMRCQMSAVESRYPRSVGCSPRGYLGFDKGDMRLDEREVNLPYPLLGLQNDRPNALVVDPLSVEVANPICRFEGFDIERVSRRSVLEIIHDRIDVGLQKLFVIHVGRVTECLVELRVLSRVIVQPQRGEDEFGERGEGLAWRWTDDSGE